jgi:iron complex outermembrane recepter protein
MTSMPSRPVLSLLAVLLLAAAPGGAALPQEKPLAEPSELKKLSIEELMQIDVTSVSRRSEPVSAAAAAVTVITAEDIRRSGVTSLPEALRLVNALEVARFDSRTWAISARGFNIGTANKLLVLIDGRTVYTPVFSGVFWDVQDLLLEDVDRIEVIRGPGAALWGANAVNGIINVITKGARETQGGLAKLGVGNEESFAALRYGGALGERAWYRTYAKYRFLDALALAAGGSAEDPLRMAAGGFRVDGDRTDRDSFTFQGQVYRGVIGELTRADTDVDGGFLLGRWARRYSAASGLDLQVVWDRSHRVVPGQFEQEHLDTWDVDLQRRLPLGGRHDLVWGLGYRVSSDQLNTTPLVAWVPNRSTRQLLSAFAQDEISLVAERLRLTVGAKLERHESTGLELQPSVRLAWTPDGRRILWGAVSRAVRAPARIEEDARFLINGIVVVQGNRDFEPEQVLAYELGYRLQPRPATSLEIATFYNVYDDLRSQEPPASGAPFPLTLGNGLNADTYGAELRLDTQAAPWWRLFASYTYLHKDLRFDPESRDRTGGAAEGNDPQQQYALRSYMDLGNRVELDAWIRHVDRLPRPLVPGYTELSLHLGWRPTDRLELALIGQNLLHEQHVEFSTAQPKAVERSVYGKVTWRF